MRSKRALTVAMTLMLVMGMLAVPVAADDVLPSDRGDDILDQDSTEDVDVIDQDATLTLGDCTLEGLEYTITLDNTANTHRATTFWFNIDGTDFTPETHTVDAGATETIDGVLATSGIFMVEPEYGVLLVDEFVRVSDHCASDIQVTVDGDTDLPTASAHEPGKWGEYVVEITNDGDPHPNYVQLALEVDHNDIDLDPADVTLQWKNDAGEWVDQPFSEQDGILYLYGENEPAIDAGYTDTQEFRASFEETGVYVGTVFVIDTGEPVSQ